MSAESCRGEDGRPDFAGFAEALREEAQWQETIKRGDRTGQLYTDVRQLHALAEKAEQIGRDQGYL